MHTKTLVDQSMTHADARARISMLVDACSIDDRLDEAVAFVKAKEIDIARGIIRTACDDLESKLQTEGIGDRNEQHVSVLASRMFKECPTESESLLQSTTEADVGVPYELPYDMHVCGEAGSEAGEVSGVYGGIESVIYRDNNTVEVLACMKVLVHDTNDEPSGTYVPLKSIEGMFM